MLGGLRRFGDHVIGLKMINGKNCGGSILNWM